MEATPERGSASIVVASIAALTAAVLAGAPEPGAADAGGPAVSGSPLRAGACAIDITPRAFPVVVNGGFLERTAEAARDRLFARCLVLDDGRIRAAIAIVDTCLMPRERVDEAKERAQAATGIPADRMLIAATHTHSAPSVMACLGSGVEKRYARFLPGRIAEGIERAAMHLAPARAGWAVVRDAEHTHCRRWILRPDRLRTDPFGRRTVRAQMHPGYENPDFVGPAGPVDPDLSVLSIRGLDGRSIALLANYSMHYFGAPPVSADYYGRFAEAVTARIRAGGLDPPFVAMMSQGTSGDLHWMDYGRPRRSIRLETYAQALAGATHAAYEKIRYREGVTLAMREARLLLRRRVPDEERLAWARRIVASMGDRRPRNQVEVYAREQILLAEEPARELKIQALRIGELGIAAIPCEVFGITGLKIKAQSPLAPTFIVELANGAEGYIPPPEQHALGGYTTWPARTAGLEVGAEPKIVESVLGLLEEVATAPRRPIAPSHGPYARSLLALEPLAYWRGEEFGGPLAEDASGRGNRGTYEGGIAFYLEGPPSPSFCGAGRINRAPHYAGGCLRARVKGLATSYTVSLWFWNGLPSDARPVTGYLFSRGPGGAAGAPGDHLGIGGTHTAAGKLLFSDGDARNEVLVGAAEIRLRRWYHVVMVRDGGAVAVYLDGRTTPEIAGRAAITTPSGCDEILVGRRCDGLAGFEGRIDEVAIFGRALTAREAAELHAAAR